MPAAVRFLSSFIQRRGFSANSKPFAKGGPGASASSQQEGISSGRLTAFNGGSSNYFNRSSDFTASTPPQLLVNCLRNNIFLSLTNAPGQTIFTLSAGRAGFPGAQKTTPKAALAMLDILEGKLAELGIERIRVNFRGLNSARPIIVGQLRRMGVGITEVVDTTGIPHNGCRPPKARRL